MRWEGTAAIASVIVALGSLAFAIVSEQNAQEREYLYKSYDRIVDLTVLVHENSENTKKKLEEAMGARSPEEATEALASFRSETVDEVTRAKWKVDLYELF